MKGTENFQKVISAELELRALRDESFKKKLENPNKNIADCINYILGEVQKSGCNGFDDEEIFGMAMHYYDEENLKVEPMNFGTVKINHMDPKAQPKSKEGNPTLF
jgi:hypothetical protein